MPSSLVIAEPRESGVRLAGVLIVNADDWGRDCDTTDRTLDCFRCGSLSSVSAMVFMRDSERAAALARNHAVDAGLHLNFTLPFSGRVPSHLAMHQERLSHHLIRYRLSQTIFHPGLSRSFEYVVAAQVDEFTRLYGREPNRLDGHHHMHLCANVLFGGLLPAGTMVRRNFSFRTGEKGRVNRLYRSAVDRVLAKRHRLTDYFFSLAPLEPQNRIYEILSIAAASVVELETHPINIAEYGFLTRGELLRNSGSLRIARGFTNSMQG